MNDKEAPHDPDNRPAVGGPVQRQVRPARAGDALRIQFSDEGPGLRWFIKRGATTWFNRGFRTKARASAWINDHGHALDWRCGYVFRLRGDPRDIDIVDRHGNVARA